MKKKMSRKDSEDVENIEDREKRVSLVEVENLNITSNNYTDDYVPTPYDPTNEQIFAQQLCSEMRRYVDYEALSLLENLTTEDMLEFLKRFNLF